jgi:hypothetical protein
MLYCYPQNQSLRFVPKSLKSPQRSFSTASAAVDSATAISQPHTLTSPSSVLTLSVVALSLAALLPHYQNSPSAQAYPMISVSLAQDQLSRRLLDGLLKVQSGL